MPLPPALIARLKKKGLIEQKKDEEEEVFAESYDDTATDGITSSTRSHVVSATMDNINTDVPSHLLGFPSGRKYLIYPRSKCPNQSNPYHRCVQYCFERWGKVPFRPDLSKLPRRLRMLTRYPLPVGWHEVADPLTGRFYYWHQDTNQVCWLAPKHPRARISQSDQRLKQIMFEQREQDFTPVSHSSKQDRRRFSSSSSSSSSDESDKNNSSSDDENEDVPKRTVETKRIPLPDRSSNAPKRNREKHDDNLDPMDPAAYSDTPRGSWSTGLDMRGKARTGVDATASGPLFQQRPYPSPGEILRANAQMQKKN